MSPPELFAPPPGFRDGAPAEPILRLLIWTGLQMSGAEEGSLLLLDEAAGDLRFVMTIGPAETEAMLRGQRVPLGAGITGLAAASREVQIGAPTFRDIRQAEHRGGPGTPEAVIAAPMVVGEHLVGVITAVSFAPGKRFTGEMGRMYGGFAAIAGLLIAQEQEIARLGRAAPANPAIGRIVTAAEDLALRHPEALEEAARMVESLARLSLPRT